MNDIMIEYEKIIKNNPDLDSQTATDLASENFIRNQRNELLKDTDWTQLNDISEEMRMKWTEYRQSLRDITLQDGFPYDIIWPEKPE